MCSLEIDFPLVKLVYKSSDYQKSLKFNAIKKLGQAKPGTSIYVKSSRQNSIPYLIMIRLK